MKRTKCIVCDNTLFEKPLFTLDNLPDSAQGMPYADDLEGDRGFRLELRKCSGCGLVQLDSEPVSYYRDAIRSCLFSETVRRYRLEQCSRFIDMFGLRGGKIIEAGCGRGEFLELFSNLGVEASGLEHNPVLAGNARAAGLRVYEGFPESEETTIEGAPYDAFVSFNFLEHLPDPNAYLRSLFRNLKDRAYGLLTVPSLEYILEEGRWYELIRDHIAYYSEETIRFCMEKNGFRVVECGRSNGDSILLAVQKRENDAPEGMLKGFSELKERLKSYIGSHKRRGEKVAVWGASHQCFTLLSAAGIAAEIEYIIDSAPFKQGRYSPATHIPIVAPSKFRADPVDAIIIIAPAYTREIENTIRREYGNKTEISAVLQNRLEIL